MSHALEVWLVIAAALVAAKLRFAAAGALFLTFAFPGFVWRYRRRGGGCA